MRAPPIPAARRHANRRALIAVMALLLLFTMGLGTHFISSAGGGGADGPLDVGAMLVRISKGGTATAPAADSTSFEPATSPAPTLPATVNGVIIFLHGGRWHSYFVRHTLPSLERHYLSCHRGKYPIRIFYEKMSDREMADVRTAVPSAKEVIFEDISRFWRTLPHGVTEAQMSQWVAAMPAFQGRGYRLMCRFWAGLVWQLPSMQQYDYYWRLDTDSAFLGSLSVDPFEVMRSGACEYGYNRLKGENPYTITGLYDTFNKWADGAIADPARRASVTAFATNKTGRYWAPMYYNNFELGTMRLKTDPLYQSMFRFMDEQQPLGILKYRWGDAPIHTLGVHSVLGVGWEDKMCFFNKTAVPYVHARKRLPTLAPGTCDKPETWPPTTATTSTRGSVAGGMEGEMDGNSLS